MTPGAMPQAWIDAAPLALKSIFLSSNRVVGAKGDFLIDEECRSPHGPRRRGHFIFSLGPSLTEHRAVGAEGQILAVLADCLEALKAPLNLSLGRSPRDK